MRGRQVQDEQRECCLYGLWGEHVLGDGRRNNVVGVFGLSFELEFGSIELKHCRVCL